MVLWLFCGLMCALKGSFLLDSSAQVVYCQTWDDFTYSKFNAFVLGPFKITVESLGVMCLYLFVV